MDKNEYIDKKEYKPKYIKIHHKYKKIGLGGVFDLWIRANTLTKKTTNLNTSKYIINTKKQKR